MRRAEVEERRDAVERHYRDPFPPPPPLPPQGFCLDETLIGRNFTPLPGTHFAHFDMEYTYNETLIYFGYTRFEGTTLRMQLQPGICPFSVL